MSESYNIYCDESCHLENDGQGVMVLGAIWCPVDKSRNIAVRIREIKRKHGLKPDFEIKWTKVSKGQLGFYLDILDYFFDDDDLHFRALIVPDKTLLNHALFHQTHDDWYYKMYFQMLSVLIKPDARFNIYIDIKDTLGADKIRKLHEVLGNSRYDFNREIIERVQIVRSNEIEQVQLADLLIGIISYANRKLSSNQAKVTLVERMKKRSLYSLSLTTLYQESKVNLFVWSAQRNFE